MLLSLIRHTFLVKVFGRLFLDPEQFISIGLTFFFNILENIFRHFLSWTKKEGRPFFLKFGFGGGNVRIFFCLKFHTP